MLVVGDQQWFVGISCTIPLGFFLLTWCSLCFRDLQNQAFSTAMVEAASGCGSGDAAERSCSGAGGFDPFPP